jgi:hypothetical protein
MKLIEETIEIVVQPERLKQIREWFAYRVEGLTDEQRRRKSEEVMNRVVDWFILKRISESDAEDIANLWINSLRNEGIYTEADIRRLNQRKDYRTYLKFFRDIRKTTKNEADTRKQYIDYLRKQNSKSVIEFDHVGIETAGNIIVIGVRGDPDYRLHVDDLSYYLEVKNCPTDDFHSFKKKDIERHSTIKDCKLLVGYKTEYLELVKKFYIYTHDGLVFLNSLEPSEYGSRIFGNKPAIRCRKCPSDIPNHKRQSETSFEFLKYQGYLLEIENEIE